MNNQTVKQWALILFVMAIVCVQSAVVVHADNHYWVGGSNWWDYSSSWSSTAGGAGGFGQPAGNDNAYLVQSGAADINVTYWNTAYPTAILNELKIDGTGAGKMVLSHTATNHPLASEIEYVGYSGKGSIIQSMGSNTISEMLYLGYNTGASGTYELSGSGTLSVNTLYLGLDGKGTFTQTGGTSTINTMYFSKYNSNNYGTYNLNGGTLNANGMYNNNGTGWNSSFYWNGGTLNPGDSGLNIWIDSFYLGSKAGVNISSSFDDAYNFWVRDLNVGNNNSIATFTQNGAICSIKQTLAVGSQGTGTYYLQNGILGSSTASFVLGYGYTENSGSGTINQSGGEAAFGSGTSIIGNAYNSKRGTHISGSYNLSGNSTLSTESLRIGNYFQDYAVTTSGSGSAPAIQGTFNQSGGVHTMTFDLLLGDYYVDWGMAADEPLPTLNALYSISGGTLQIGRNMQVGSNAYVDSSYTGEAGIFAQFYQGGGAVTVEETLRIGQNLFNAAYTLDDGSLTAQILTLQQNGMFYHEGGANHITSSMTIGSGAGYRLNGGTLTAEGIVLDDGEFTQNSGVLDASIFTQNGGIINGEFQNQGLFQYSGGAFSGRFLNQGSVAIYADFTAGNGILNDNYFYIDNNRVVTANGTGFLNNDTLSINSGTLRANGDGLTNLGTIAIYGGGIEGSGDFLNYGLLSQDSGTLSIAGTGLNKNLGTINLNPGSQFRIGGSGLENSGALNLNGAIVSGTSPLLNLSGGTLTGSGTILAPFGNNGGRIVVQAGTTNITRTFTNSGMIQLVNPTAGLVGGTLANSGTIEGYGLVGNAIVNTGTIEALNGTLNLSGSVENRSSGMLTAGKGAKLMAQAGLAANDGLINLTGGTFDNNSHGLTNNNQISGYGIIRTGGLTNEGNIIITGGITTVNGAVINNNMIEAAYNPVIFTGNVTNNGIFKSTDTTVTFTGNYIENGGYISDPSHNYFTDLIVNETGYLVGGMGDYFHVSNDFLNHSGQEAAWNTSRACLNFTSGADTDHQYVLMSDDLGFGASGYQDNFSWGSLDISGNRMTLVDGDGDGTGALYVREILGLEISQGNITNIFSQDGLNIYYLGSLPSNSYLNGLTYDLTNGGKLAASSVPVPGSILLLFSGLLCLTTLRRQVPR